MRLFHPPYLNNCLTFIRIMTTTHSTTQENEIIMLSRAGVSIERVSPEVAAASRKNVAAILRAIALVGQAVMADRLEVHGASITRMKEPGSDVERMALILAAAGIELPSATQRVYPVDVVEALRTLASTNLSCLSTETEKLGICSN
jgi:hypothetical protein